MHDLKANLHLTVHWWAITCCGDLDSKRGARGAVNVKYQLAAELALVKMRKTRRRRTHVICDFEFLTIGLGPYCLSVIAWIDGVWRVCRVHEVSATANSPNLDCGAWHPQAVNLAARDIDVDVVPMVSPDFAMVSFLHLYYAFSALARAVINSLPRVASIRGRRRVGHVEDC